MLFPDKLTKKYMWKSANSSIPQPIRKHLLLCGCRVARRNQILPYPPTFLCLCCNQVPPVFSCHQCCPWTFAHTPTHQGQSPWIPFWVHCMGSILVTSLHLSKARWRQMHFRQRIDLEYKLCVLLYMYLQQAVSTYRAEMGIPVSASVSWSCVHSLAHVVSHSRTTRYGQRSFAVSGPTMCNI